MTAIIYGLHSVAGLAVFRREQVKFRYVGQTTQEASERFAQHLNHPSLGVGRWIQKEGRENIQFVILETLPDDATQDDIDFAEARWIHHFHWTPGYPPLLNRRFSARFRVAWERANRGPSTDGDPKEFW